MSDASSAFDRSFHDLILVEGGYANNPLDRGGRTKYGVTERTARSFGYRGSMRDLTLDQAKSIYKRGYWDSLELDTIADIDYALAHELFDTGVNMGPGRAAEFLQRCLNALNNRGQHYADLRIDRDIGPRTIAALQALVRIRGQEGKTVLFRMLNALQGAFYISLAERDKSQEAFVFGWFRTRVR